MNIIKCDVFFFSSRRRHTRCLSDWSSDVCSSDLLLGSSFSSDEGPLGVEKKSCCLRAEVRFIFDYTKDRRGVDLISDALPFGRLWYGEANAISNAIDYAKFFSRSHNAVIRVYDEAGNVIEMHEHAGDFKEW